ncbi:MAG: domain S-box protein, partial [Chitinophagaceae bacterium]|nr:domain S-box protein [Chitinophagaceae bacterium]
MKFIRILKPYLITLLIIAFLVSIKLSLPSLNTLVLSLVFFFGIILVTRYYGLGPGFLFLFVSTFIYLQFLIKPEVAKALYTTGGIIRLLAFFLQFAIIIFITHQFSRLKKRQTASEIRFKALIEKSHTAVVLLNEQAKKIYVSPTIQALLGYTAEEFMKIEAFVLLEPEVLEEYNNQFLEFKNDYGKSITLTHKYKHKNGNYIFVESTITNLLNQKGVNAIVINFRDLNEQKQAEELARRKTKSLEILNEIGISISEQLDLQSILQKVTDATTKL